jgi:hypothetical protein
LERASQGRKQDNGQIDGDNRKDGDEVSDRDH